MLVRSSPASIVRLLIGLSIVLSGLSILLSRLIFSGSSSATLALLFCIGAPLGASMATAARDRRALKLRPLRSRVARDR